jgi:16S rRNA (uracil1498-N3)-methyltransferase
LRRAHVDKAVLDAIDRGRVALPATTAHRFFRVLRLPAGTIVELFDGAGRIARGTLEPPGELVDIELRAASDPLPPLVVAQAVTKTEKLELVVQKGTELGASAFLLVDCARSHVHLGDRAPKRRERLQRVAEDAARQSGRVSVPSIEGPVRIAEVCERVRAFPGVAALGVLSAEAPLTEVLAADPERAARGLFVVIGPEGGLDDSEVRALEGAGVAGVRLGAHVLRTETAALAALAAAQATLGHL